MSKNLTGATISKDYIEEHIDNEIRACEARVTEARSKMHNLELSVEYEMGILSAYHHTKFLLVDE